MHDQIFVTNLSCEIFVLLLVKSIVRTETIIDKLNTQTELILKRKYITPSSFEQNNNTSQERYRSSPRHRHTVEKTLPLHITIYQDMTTTDKILVLIAHDIDLLIHHHIDVTLVLDKNRILSPETIDFKNTPFPFRPTSMTKDSRNSLFRSHFNDTSRKILNQTKNPLILHILKYTSITIA